MSNNLDEDAELAKVEKDLVAFGATENAPAGKTLAQEAAAAQEAANAEAAARLAAGKTPEQLAAEAAEEGVRHRLTGKLAAVSVLVKAGIPEEEAFSRVYGKPVADPAVVAAAAAEAAKPDPMVDLQRQLAEAQTTINEAGDGNSLFTPELRNAIDKRDELREQIRDLKAQQQNSAYQQAHAKKQKFDADWQTNEGWAIAHYEQAGVVDSPLNKLVEAKLDAIVNDESHELYGKPIMVKHAYAEAAIELGLIPKKVTAVAKPTGFTPASAGTKTTPPPVVTTATVQADFQARQAKAAAEGNDDELAALAEEELTFVATGTAKRPSHRPGVTFR